MSRFSEDAISFLKDFVDVEGLDGGRICEAHTWIVTPKEGEILPLINSKFLEYEPEIDPALCGIPCKASIQTDEHSIMIEGYYNERIFGQGDGIIQRPVFTVGNSMLGIIVSTINSSSLEQYRADVTNRMKTPDNIYGKNRQRVLYSHGTTVSIYQAMTRRGRMVRCRSISADDKSISIFMSLFAIFPSFEVWYKGYLSFCDEGAIIQNANDSSASVMEFIRDTHENSEENTRTKGEMELIIHLIIICAFKRIPSQQDATFRRWFDDRKKAACLAIKCESYENINELYADIHFDDLVGLSEYVNFYPKVKTFCINILAAHAKELWVKQTLTILQDTQLTAFNLIQKFLTSTPKTLAHIHPVIMQEADNWLTIYKNIIDRHPKTWKFLKLLEPHNTETQINNFPELSAVAVLWATMLPEFESLAQYQLANRKKAYTYSYHLVRRIPNEYLLEGAAHQAHKLSESLAQFMSLKYHEVVANLDRIRAEGPDDHLVKQLETAKTSIANADNARKNARVD